MPVHQKQHILQREWENVETERDLEVGLTWCTVHMPRVDGCTYAMGLRGVREEEAKNLTNGVSRDPERERARKHRKNI